jgi:hypothetical protein
MLLKIKGRAATRAAYGGQVVEKKLDQHQGEHLLDTLEVS